MLRKGDGHALAVQRQRVRELSPRDLNEFDRKVSQAQEPLSMVVNFHGLHAEVIRVAAPERPATRRKHPVRDGSRGQAEVDWGSLTRIDQDPN